MKVYLVHEIDYDWNVVVGVFLNESNAIKCRDNCEQRAKNEVGCPDCHIIIEHEVKDSNE